MTRAVIVVLLLASTSALTRATRTDDPQSSAALAALPYTIGSWSGTNVPLDADTRRQLGADTYVTRIYTAAGELPVDLYVAYYAQQRPGVSIHSPLHCLPGTGWEPLDVSTIDLPAGQARRMIVRKNLDRALVLYWYAIHNRVLASELASKAWLLHDSIRLGRSDAALVRIVVPIKDSVEAADRESLAFARALVPHVTLQE
jgi:EpsI family protein